MRNWSGRGILKKTFTKFLIGLFVLQHFAFTVPLAAAAVTNIPVGASPFGIATTPDGAKAYVANSGSDEVSVIDTATDTVLTTIPVVGGPLMVAVTPDGAKAYVTVYGSDEVSVIDTATDTVLTTIPVGVTPYHLAITPDGTKVYVANQYGNSVSVIDTATDTVLTTIPVGGDLYFVIVSPDGTKAYAEITGTGDIVVISTATDTVLTTIPTVGGGPLFGVFTPDSAKLYVTASGSSDVWVIDTTTDTVATTVPVGNVTQYLTVTPDGAKVYVTNAGDDTVSVIDTGTDTVSATVPVGDLPIFISITPDGGRVYAVNSDSDDVSVIDTATDTVSATIPVGDNPFFLAITPDGAKVYVTNVLSDNVSVFLFDYVPSGPTPNTTDNRVILSREAVNAPATATIYFTLGSTLSSQLTLTFDAAFTGMNVSGATASTPSVPGCMTNFQVVDGHTFTADKSGCTGPVVISGVTVVNPPTPGPYLVSWENDDPGYAMVAIVDDDQVTVNAQVDPTITFDLDTNTTGADTPAPYSVDLGALTVGTVNHSDNAVINSIFAQLDTNATGGAIVTVLSAYAALQSTSVPGDVIPNDTLAMSAGTANYGICVNNATPPSAASGAFVRVGLYNTGSCNPASSSNMVKALSTVTPTAILGSTSAPLTGGQAEIIVNAAIDTSTAAHSDYSDTLTFVATGMF